MNVGSLLREARQRHGLDQRELAERAGTSQAQISRIERGESSPRFATVERLLRAMDEQLVVRTAPLWPGQDVEEAQLSPAERVLRAAELSRLQTALAGRPRRD